MAVSGITNLAQLQTFSITMLRRELQRMGNMRRYCRDYNAYKTAEGRRQPVRVPRFASQGPLGLANPDDGLMANAASLTHTVIEWKAGSDATDTSHPLAYSYDRWEADSSPLAVETIMTEAAVQVARYEQTFDNDVFAELKGSTNWGASANQMPGTFNIADGDALTKAETDTIIKAALNIPWEYYSRGMIFDPATGGDDGSPKREIICVLNTKLLTSILENYFESYAVGRATMDAAWLQANIGPMFGGMKLAVSHGMDNGFTSAGDEYAVGTFLQDAIGYVTDDSPMISAQGYTGDNPNLEWRMGFWRDHGIKVIVPNEVLAIKATVA